jgi:DNA-binding NarL/FixJ family response regulator
MFVVQESIHADSVSRHETVADALAAIDEMVREGIAQPGEFNVREVDDRGRTIRVVSTSQPPAGALLTGRELEVLRLVAAGVSNDDIGHRLRISPATVRSHVRHVLTKLGAESKAEAVEAARREALVA